MSVLQHFVPSESSMSETPVCDCPSSFQSEPTFPASEVGNLKGEVLLPTGHWQAKWHSITTEPLTPSCWSVFCYTLPALNFQSLYTWIWHMFTINSLVSILVHSECSSIDPTDIWSHAIFDRGGPGGQFIPSVFFQTGQLIPCHSWKGVQLIFDRHG